MVLLDAPCPKDLGAGALRTRKGRAPSLAIGERDLEVIKSSRIETAREPARVADELLLLLPAL